METRRITWWALGALLLGLVGGAYLAREGVSWLEKMVSILEPIGTVWINAVRMTIIPLVCSLLIAAIASSDSLRGMSRLGGTAMVFFVAVLSSVAVFVALVGPVLMSGLTIDPESSDALRATATSGSQQVQATVRGMGGLAQRIVELVPANPIRAAADATLLPLVVFSMIFGAALSRVQPDLRDGAIKTLRAVSEAMLVIIRWVFVVAPLGVFALATVVGARLGFKAITAAGHYVVSFALLMIGVMVGVYVVAIVFGRVSFKTFASAVGPAQVIALGSRSSSAALPAMIDAARGPLGLPPQIVNFVLPMAVSIFRISVPISFVLGGLFLGKLYGVEIGTSQVISLAVASVLLSFSVPPVPSGSLFIMAPAFVEMGLPVEGVAILIALDVIPDLFKTSTIVTAHVASAVVVSRVAGKTT
jgi:proton glutamate symport protein